MSQNSNFIDENLFTKVTNSTSKESYLEKKTFIQKYNAVYNKKMSTADLNDTTLTVLLLEDNPREALIVQQTLEIGWKANVTIHRYLKVHDIVSHLNHSSPDIILLDLNVLDSEGINTVEVVVKGNHAAVPIIVTTSMKDQKKAVQALELGVQDYVVKGEYSAESLTKAIRFARARAHSMGTFSGSSTKETLDLDGICVDLMNQAINYFDGLKNQRIELTSMEVKLAAYFIKNVGQELSRDELRNRVWGEETSISDRVIDNQVSRLRSKIKPTSFSIQSVRGIGYCLKKVS